jgi:hypothetical protein
MAQLPNKIGSGGNAADRAREQLMQSRTSGQPRLTPPGQNNNAMFRAIQKSSEYKQSGRGDFTVPAENNAAARARNKTMEDKQRRMMGG